MSAVVSGVLNSTIGLLSSKLRDYTAKRLSDGDLNDEQCRRIVVRELDDIKSKLDGLSRKDLLAALSFFKEGVTRLYSSLETSTRGSSDRGSSLQALVNTAQEATVEPTAQRCDISQTASEFSSAIGKLKIASEDRYKSGKESFRESKRLSTEAFNNVSLNTEDRVMASKFRIASRILECLDDPEAAVRDCLLYLQELQDLPSIQALVSVWTDSEKGITGRVRARFNKERRDVAVESIQLINTLLIDLVMKFTNISMAFSQWPTIRTTNGIYHPLTQNDKAFAENDRTDLNVPWIYEFLGELDYIVCALFSNGEILSSSGERQDRLQITKRSGRQTWFTTNLSKAAGNLICGLTIDENDYVHAVIKISSRPDQYKLVTFDASGNEKSSRFLGTMDGVWNWRLQIGTTKAGTTVIYSTTNQVMYVFDDTYTKSDIKFPVPSRGDEALQNIYSCRCTVTDRNEIICTFLRKDENAVFMHIITTGGRLKRSVKIPAVVSRITFVSVGFNYVNETILVSLATSKFINQSDDSIVPVGSFTTTIYTLSSSGDLLDEFKIPGCYQRLLTHPKGTMSLVNEHQAVMLQV